MEGSEVLSKNLLDFLHYKKYSADSEITYDIPKDIGVTAIPDDKMQEKPPVDCKDPKNKDAGGMQERSRQEIAEQSRQSSASSNSCLSR